MPAVYLDISTHLRSRGQSAAAAVAYAFGAKVQDARSGATHDYSARQNAGDIVATAICAARGTPLAANEQILCTAIESAERRSDARILRTITIALPAELPPGPRTKLAIDFGRYLAKRYDTVVPCAVHQPDPDGNTRNHHAHLILPTRALAADGQQLGSKLRQLDVATRSGDEIAQIRNHITMLMNRALKRARVPRVHQRSAGRAIDAAVVPKAGAGLVALARKSARARNEKVHRRSAAELVAAAVEAKDLDGGLAQEISRTYHEVARTPGPRRYEPRARSRRARRVDAAATAKAEPKAERTDRRKPRRRIRQRTPQAHATAPQALALAHMEAEAEAEAETAAAAKAKAKHEKIEADDPEVGQLSRTARSAERPAAEEPAQASPAAPQTPAATEPPPPPAPTPAAAHQVPAQPPAPKRPPAPAQKRDEQQEPEKPTRTGRIELPTPTRESTASQQLAARDAADEKMLRTFLADITADHGAALITHHLTGQPAPEIGGTKTRSGQRVADAMTAAIEHHINPYLRKARKPHWRSRAWRTTRAITTWRANVAKDDTIRDAIADAMRSPFRGMRLGERIVAQMAERLAVEAEAAAERKAAKAAERKAAKAADDKKIEEDARAGDPDAIAMIQRAAGRGERGRPPRRPVGSDRAPGRPVRPGPPSAERLNGPRTRAQKPRSRTRTQLSRAQLPSAPLPGSSTWLHPRSTHSTPPEPSRPQASSARMPRPKPRNCASSPRRSTSSSRRRTTSPRYSVTSPPSPPGSTS